MKKLECNRCGLTTDDAFKKGDLCIIDNCGGIYELQKTERKNVPVGDLVRQFALGIVKKDLEISVLGQPITLPLIWAENMVGAIPVFSDIESAEKYNGLNATIYEMNVEKQTA